MILNVHVPGAPCYEIAEEIWQQPLAEAIRAEAETIAHHAGPELLPSPSQVSDPMPSPVVQEVLRFEDLPLGSAAARRAIARWSDGSESVALSWYGDEILSPVDHFGRQ
jgi:hypothetical protein